MQQPDADGSKEGRRPRGPGRPRLPVDRIIAAALLTVDEDGADGLTLRSLAARLGSSTATLYRHFPGRAELVRAVVDSLFAEVHLDEEILANASWDTSLLQVARNMFTVLDRHRNATPLLLNELPAGIHALSLRERCLQVLTTSGFDAREAVQIYATLARYVLGFGVQASSESAVRATTTSGSSIGSISLSDEFEYGLQLMIDGLRTRHDSRTNTTR